MYKYFLLLAFDSDTFFFFFKKKDFCFQKAQDVNLYDQILLRIFC